MRSILNRMLASNARIEAEQAKREVIERELEAQVREHLETLRSDGFKRDGVPWWAEKDDARNYGMEPQPQPLLAEAFRLCPGLEQRVSLYINERMVIMPKRTTKAWWKAKA